MISIRCDQCGHPMEGCPPTAVGTAVITTTDGRKIPIVGAVVAPCYALQLCQGCQISALRALAGSLKGV